MNRAWLRHVPAAFVAVLVLALQAWAIATSLPQPQSSREVAMAAALAGWPARASLQASVPVSLDPRAFCAAWSGEAVEHMDCRSGYRLSDLTASRSADSARILQQGRTALAQRLADYDALALVLRTASQEWPLVQQPLAAVQARAAALSNVLARPLSDTDTRSSYALLFDALLSAHGQRYDAFGNRFSVVRWDVARLLDENPAVLVRAAQTSRWLTWIPGVWMACSALLMVLGWHRARWVGLWATACVATLLLLGWWLSAVASLHFGEGSWHFALNPLGNQWLRQAAVLSLCAVVLLALLARPASGLRAACLAQAHPSVLALLLLPAVLGVYAASGPALGSEALKLAVALQAGALTAGMGRMVHAARMHAPQLLSPLTWWRAGDDTALIARRHLGVPLASLAGFLGLTLLCVAGFFHDLGAVLVATLVGVLAVYLVFGLRPALMVGAMLALIGGSLLMTDKLQDRLALMRDPWTAHVSDFARLQAFIEAAGPWGFGLDALPWCNDTGACLPLQVLSDYMPVLLQGAWGPVRVVSLFLAVCLGLISLAVLVARRYLLDQGPERVLAMTSFYLLLATLLQLVVTFFGNWRWIPLTGLGTPLLSIGLSSALAPVVGVGLALQVKARHQGETTR